MLGVFEEDYENSHGKWCLAEPVNNQNYIICQANQNCSYNAYN